MPTWKPPESADSLPTRIRSNGPPSASRARTASVIATAVARGSQSLPSVSSRTARSTPIAIASRSWSAASGGPSVSTTDSPPLASISRTASSTAHSSCGLTTKPRKRVSIVRPSSARLIRPPVAGTRLTQGQDAHRPTRQLRIRVVVRIEQRRAAGDRDGDRVALAEVLDEELVARPRPARAAGTT